MIRTGYCPWCGKEIIPLAFSPTLAQIDWDRCNTPRCRGNNLELITDYGGWVLYPKKIEGRYIGSKPNKSRKAR